MADGARGLEEKAAAAAEAAWELRDTAAACAGTYIESSTRTEVA
jgi:hypothetical protein